MFTYLARDCIGRYPARVVKTRAHLIFAADAIVAAYLAHGYRRPVGESYYWGCNGSVARQVLILHAAYRIEPKPAYLDVSLDALSHLFGRIVAARAAMAWCHHDPVILSAEDTRVPQAETTIRPTIGPTQSRSNRTTHSSLLSPPGCSLNVSDSARLISSRSPFYPAAGTARAACSAAWAMFRAMPRKIRSCRGYRAYQYIRPHSGVGRK